MTNPFDNEAGQFYVLVNADGEHSLWPTFAAVPGGWTITHGPASRKICLDYVETHWVDMRPKSLIDATRETN
ncbi:MbtH family protein [Nocardia donostiensis]|uniref:MbtH family protein n=1 Tax=Nocardia donostiensis TaxID=1538463 RepID=A0A1V2TC36_9NOCA|nr:MbtH family protein [Nocardia donostiensis]ONM47092.1 MbtH family protein [Nocardia donostiensis]OQS15237.1 MbtH family protein [Nocardia donostiensis]OQS20077.1 MbtH family protein [Nocardia donostiensis]